MRARPLTVCAAVGRVSSARTCSWYARLLLPSVLWVGASTPTVVATHERLSSYRMRRRWARLFPPPCSWYASVLPSSVFLVCASFPLVCTVVGVCPPSVSACTVEADAVDTAPCMCRRSCGGGHRKEQRLTDAAVRSQLSSNSVQKTGQSMACDIRTAYEMTEKSIHPHEASYRQQHSKVNCQHTTTERRAGGAPRANP